MAISWGDRGIFPFFLSNLFRWLEEGTTERVLAQCAAWRLEVRHSIEPGLLSDAEMLAFTPSHALDVYLSWFTRETDQQGQGL